MLIIHEPIIIKKIWWKFLTGTKRTHPTYKMVPVRQRTKCHYVSKLSTPLALWKDVSLIKRPLFSSASVHADKIWQKEARSDFNTIVQVDYINILCVHCFTDAGDVRIDKTLQERILMQSGTHQNCSFAVFYLSGHVCASVMKRLKELKCALCIKSGNETKWNSGGFCCVSLALEHKT